MTFSASHLSIDPTAVVCKDATLFGDVTIGPNTVVHPKCKIDGSAGAIVIGADNIIEEKVVICSTETGTMEIGSGNSFRVGAECFAKKVGNHNIFEIKSHVGKDVIINNECRIGPMGRVEGEQEVSDRTILLYGHIPYRMEVGTNSNATQIELLAKNLPNYHKLINTSKS